MYTNSDETAGPSTRPQYIASDETTSYHDSVPDPDKEGLPHVAEEDFGDEFSAPRSVDVFKTLRPAEMPTPGIMTYAEVQLWHNTPERGQKGVAAWRVTFDVFVSPIEEFGTGREIRRRYYVNLASPNAFRKRINASKDPNMFQEVKDWHSENSRNLPKDALIGSMSSGWFNETRQTDFIQFATITGHETDNPVLEIFFGDGVLHVFDNWKLGNPVTKAKKARNEKASKMIAYFDPGFQHATMRRGWKTQFAVEKRNEISTGVTPPDDNRIKSLIDLVNLQEFKIDSAFTLITLQDTEIVQLRTEVSRLKDMRSDLEMLRSEVNRLLGHRV